MEWRKTCSCSRSQTEYGLRIWEERGLESREELSRHSIGQSGGRGDESLGSTRKLRWRLNEEGEEEEDHSWFSQVQATEKHFFQ